MKLIKLAAKAQPKMVKEPEVTLDMATGKRRTQKTLIRLDSLPRRASGQDKVKLF